MAAPAVEQVGQANPHPALALPPAVFAPRTQGHFYLAGMGTFLLEPDIRPALFNIFFVAPFVLVRSFLFFSVSDLLPFFALAPPAVSILGSLFASGLDPMVRANSFTPIVSATRPDGKIMFTLALSGLIFAALAHAE